jgi:hypothetical protein
VAGAVKAAGLAGAAQHIFRRCRTLMPRYRPCRRNNRLLLPASYCRRLPRDHNLFGTHLQRMLR